MKKNKHKKEENIIILAKFFENSRVLNDKHLKELDEL